MAALSIGTCRVGRSDPSAPATTPHASSGWTRRACAMIASYVAWPMVSTHRAWAAGASRPGPVRTLRHGRGPEASTRRGTSSRHKKPRYWQDDVPRRHRRMLPAPCSATVLAQHGETVTVLLLADLAGCVPVGQPRLAGVRARPATTPVAGQCVHDAGDDEHPQAREDRPPRTRTVAVVVLGEHGRARSDEIGRA